MYEIIFYKDRREKEPIVDYIRSLQAKQGKDSRIKYNKIMECFAMLREYGTRIGEPTVKHIEGKIWELRPRDDRFFFFYWDNDTFVMLHHYTKKSNKMPRKEFDQALRNLADFLERTDEDEGNQRH